LTNQGITDKETKGKLGKRIISFLITEENRLKLKRYLKNKSRTRRLRKEFKESGSQLKDLNRVCSENTSYITAPLALISQIQRSGGTLLSQLFDGHPEIHAHPDELQIGNPKKYIWPRINLSDSPEQWFEMLFEDIVIRFFKTGYKKMPKQVKYDETFPFVFLPSLQRKIFLNYIDSVESITQRDVFNAYMTSYFGAWLNNQNNYGPKNIVTAFTPRLAMPKDNMESFFQIYPDGRLISIIRDPKNWFPSALRHDERKYGDIRYAIGQWKDSAQAMLRNKARYGHNVCIIRFEDLVSDTERVMRYLAQFLNIEFENILLMPTFNKLPIVADTSFRIEKPGIIASTLSRYKTLKEEEVEIINEMTREVYQMVLDAAVKC